MTDAKNEAAGGASRSDAVLGDKPEIEQKCAVHGILPMGVFMCRHHGFNHACHYTYHCEHQENK